MSADLELAYDGILQQAYNAKKLMAYYNGDQPLMYSHERLRQVFERSNVNFVQNWCAVVIDTSTDRLVFKGYDSPKDEDDILKAFYVNERLPTISRRVHKDAVITGDGYVMVDYLDGEIKAYYNSPQQVVVFYDDNDAETKRLGAKYYFDKENNEAHLNLYYPDRIEKYIRKGVVSTSSGFVLEEEMANVFNQVPIVHFRVPSELTNVVPLQDAINKTFSDMMVVSEFAAFPQRWMITNADISSLIASPQSIMRIPKGMSDEEGTSVGEFGTANLGMYLDTIDKLTNTIAVISRTPKHYFLNTGSNISGEALNVMETPLVKKVIQLQEAFSESWIELAKFVSPAENTVCVWERPETEQIITQTNAMKAFVDMGVPLITVLRKFGWADDEIEQMLSDMQEEKARNADMAQSALALAALRLQQSNEPYLEESNTQTQVEMGEGA